MSDNRQTDSFIVADAEDGLPLAYCRTKADFKRWAQQYAKSWDYEVALYDTPMLYAQFTIQDKLVLTVYGVMQFFYSDTNFDPEPL